MFYGLDVHKEFIQVCALGSKGTKRREFRVAASAEAVERFARGLRSGDHVVLEATFHTWALHDILTRHVRHVVVANPLQVKAIAHAKVKTDTKQSGARRRSIEERALGSQIHSDRLSENHATNQIDTRGG